MSSHPSDLLSAFLDEELSSSELSELTAHLADCHECRADLDSLASVRSQVRGLPVIEPAPGFADAGRQVVSLVPRLRRTLVGAAAAAAVVLVVGVAVGSNRSVVPLQFEQVVDQHVARASFDSGFNVIQVQAVANR